MVFNGRGMVHRVRLPKGADKVEVKQIKEDVPQSEQLITRQKGKSVKPDAAKSAERKKIAIDLFKTL